MVILTQKLEDIKALFGRNSQSVRSTGTTEGIVTSNRICLKSVNLDYASKNILIPHIRSYITACVSYILKICTVFIRIEARASLSYK